MRQFPLKSGYLLLAAAMVATLSFAPQADARNGKGKRGGGMSIFDGTPTETDCRACHGDATNLPHPLLQVTNSDKHHALIGEPIVGLADGLFDTVAPGDTSTGLYECMTCHGVHNTETDSTTGTGLVITDCLVCHPVSTVTGSPGSRSNVHHYTDAFYDRDCRSCHRF